MDGAMMMDTKYTVVSCPLDCRLFCFSRMNTGTQGGGKHTFRVDSS